MARGSTIAVRVVGDVSGLSRDLSKAETRVDKFASVMGRLRLPVLAAGAASFKMAADFDSSMSKIVGLVGIASDEVDAMGEQVRNLSGEVAKSPTELADALFFVTSAGLRGRKAMEALEASARASAAGLGETAIVADAVTSAMNAYASSGLSAEEATDILVATVREGKVAADELAGSVGRVLPVAAELGVSFDQVGASIAAMTRLGLGAEESVTALRGLFATLLKPAAQAEGALESVGLSVTGLKDQLAQEGLLSVLQTLAERFEGNDEALTKVIPNVRALTGFFNLTGDAAGEAAGIFERMEDTTGALDDAFGAASETIEFRFNTALARAGDVALEVRDPLTRFLGQVIPLFEGLTHEMALTERAINAVKDGVVRATGPVDAFAQGLLYADGVITDSTDTTLRYVDALIKTPAEAQKLIDQLDVIAETANLSEEELATLAAILRGRVVGAMTDAETRAREAFLMMRTAAEENLPDVRDELAETREEAEELSRELSILRNRLIFRAGDTGRTTGDDPLAGRMPGRETIEFRHQGGTVPGTPGTDQLIMAQAGETVTRRAGVHTSGAQVINNISLQQMSDTQIRELMEIARRQ